MILIPIKNLSNAKQRLGDVLDQSVRTELAHAMLDDVLEAVVDHGREDVSLVTSDSFALEQAGAHGFEVIPDTTNTSETDAIAMATAMFPAANSSVPPKISSASISMATG